MHSGILSQRLFPPTAKYGNQALSSLFQSMVILQIQSGSDSSLLLNNHRYSSSFNPHNEDGKESILL